MKPRYTKRVREEAALICAIAASTPPFHSDFQSTCEELGIDVTSQSADLAYAAWFHVNRHSSSTDNDWPRHDAEAEALIRTGWSPK